MGSRIISTVKLSAARRSKVTQFFLINFCFVTVANSYDIPAIVQHQIQCVEWYILSAIPEIELQMSGLNVLVYLKKSDDDIRSVIDKTFLGIYEPDEVHYVVMDATMEEYWKHATTFAEKATVANFFVVYDGSVTSYGERYFHIIFTDGGDFEHCTKIPCTASALSVVGLAGVLGNRTPEELYERSLDCTDDVLRYPSW